MKTILVQITAQYYENYSDTDKPYWKPKMGQEFFLRADSDDFMYGLTECIAAIKKMLEKQSNSRCRYEYVSHELIFHESIELSTDEFEANLKEIYQQREKV